MSKSTQLVTATYIVSHVAASHPQKVNTDGIAKVVQTHPSRVRRIVSKLVKSGILRSNRGSAGGILLGRDAGELTLADIYDAVQEQPILSLGLHEREPGENGIGCLKPIFQGIYDNLESKMRDELGRIAVTDVAKNSDEEIVSACCSNKTTD